MAMAPAFGSPKAVRISSSVFVEVKPFQADASWNSRVPSFSESQVSAFAFPSTMSPSKPAFFSCGPKSPPQFEQRYIRVSGDLVESWNLVVDTRAVPVRGPVMKMILFSGESASTVGPISSW